MTHSYLTTFLENEIRRDEIKKLLLSMENISDIHFPINKRHISITLNSYASLEKINKYILDNKENEFKIIKQIDVSPDFTESSETTGKILKELGLILGGLFFITLAYGLFHEFHQLNNFIQLYLGFLLIIFGTLKLFNFLEFAESHQRYDLISKHFVLYAYLYPFIEITLGFFILLNKYLFLIYLLLIFIFFLRVLSVLYSIAFSRGVEYAYLEGFFKIRISYMTIIVDSLIILFGILQIYLFLN